MAKIEDIVEGQSRTLNAIQGLEIIEPSDGKGDIVAIEQKLNSIISALAQIRNSPSADIPQGEEIEPIMPVPNLVEGPGIQISHVGTAVMISLVPVEEGTGDPDGEEEGSGSIPDGTVDGDMLVWVDGIWTIETSEEKVMVSDVTYNSTDGSYLRDSQLIRIMLTEDEVLDDVIVTLVDCSDGLYGGDT